MSAQKRNRYELLRMLYRTYGRYTWSIVTLGLLGIVGSVFVGVGAGSLIPLFSLAIGAHTSPESSEISALVERIFTYLPVSFGIKWLLIVIVVLFLLRALILLLIGYIRSLIQYRFKYDLINGVLRSILSARWSFLVREKIGNIQGILLKDIDESALFLAVIAKLVVNALSALVLLWFTLFISWRTAVAALVVALPLLFFYRVLVQKTRVIGTGLSLQQKRVSQYITEHITGIKSIKASAAEENVMSRGSGFFSWWKDLEIKKAVFRTISAHALEPVGILFVSAAFAFTYTLSGFSIEVFTATIFLIHRVFIYLEAVQGNAHSLAEIIPFAVSVDAFQQKLQREQEKDEREGRPFSFEREIEFEHVALSYTGAPVLRDVSFSVGKGEMVGIVGASGSGKTTVADLLLRFFEPDNGTIRADGVAIGSMRLSEWREHIGYVSQDIFLLNDSVENNIRFYDNTISDKAVREAARQAGIHDFLHTLPEGYQTSVGDRGLLFSGGQRQRIVLARILARKPHILVLDEATSSLDSESEKAVQETIEDLKGTVTIISIAHRISTVMNADTVLVLNEGKIAESGSPRELLEEKESLFAEFARLQNVS